MMKKILYFLLALVIAVGFADCANSDKTPDEDNLYILGNDDFVAWFVETPPVIDGIGDDEAWTKAQWQPIKYEWMYDTPPNITPVKGPDDFSGRFKVVWTADRLYILAEIIDDIISTTRLATPYTNPENDDCLELFIDENASGGTRTSDGGNNFFVYHLSFGGINAVDHIGGSYNNTGTDDPTRRVENGNILRNGHVNYVIGKDEVTNTYTWEIELKVYDNTYPLNSSPDVTPVTLTEGKKMGFAIAYCDADEKNTREHFIGSMFVTGDTDNERNVAYRDSTQYAKLYLVKDASTAPLKPPVQPSVVSLVQATTVAQAADLGYADILALTRQAIDLAGGLDGIVKEGDVVVLKPNVIVTRYHWGWGEANIPELVNGVCTDRRVIQAVAEIVREIIGPAGTIMVIEGSGSGSTMTNYSNLGYTLENLVYVDEIIALENEGAWSDAGDASDSMDYVTQVTLENFVYKGATGSYARYYKNDGKYWVNKKMYEADALICIPVVKNHWNAVVTGAIKNIGIGAAPPRIYGIASDVVGRNNMVNHASPVLHDWIADYFSCIPADFVVMDGLQGLQGGPLPGVANDQQLAAHQKNLRSILASRDPLAIDIVETNIVGWDYTDVPYLTKLARRGEVGPKPNGRIIPLRGDPKDIVVLGNIKVDDIRGDYEGTMQPNNTGRKIPAAQTKPDLAITSAVFSGSSLNLDMTLSSGTHNNVVKIDIYVDGAYATSFNSDTGMTSVSFDTSSLTAGPHTIEVRAYTQFMYSAAASITAIK